MNPNDVEFGMSEHRAPLCPTCKDTGRVMVRHPGSRSTPEYSEPDDFEEVDCPDC